MDKMDEVKDQESPPDNNESENNQDVATPESGEVSDSQSEEKAFEEGSLKALKEGLGKSIGKTTDDGKAEEGDKANEDQPKKDEEEDPYEPPEEGLKPRTKARIEKLIAINKEKDHALQDISERFEETRGQMEQAGVTSDEFSTMMNYASHVKSGNTAEAIKILTGELRGLYIAKGEVPPEDLLNLYDSDPEIKEKVEAFEMSEADAIKAIKARADEAKRVDAERQVATEKELAERDDIEKKNAFTEYQKLHAQWQGSDINFRSNISELEKHAPAIINEFHPSQWVSEIKRLYTVIQSSRKGVTKTLNGDVPITPKSGGGNISTKPMTQEEFIRQGLSTFNG